MSGVAKAIVDDELEQKPDFFSALGLAGSLRMPTPQL
jgi:hypothetical protein